MMPEPYKTRPGITEINFSLVIEDENDKTPQCDWVCLVKNIRYAINEHYCLGLIYFFGGNENYGPQHRRVAWVGLCADNHIQEMMKNISDDLSKCPNVTVAFISGGKYEKL